jgi:Uma2 family endonuclease
MPVQTLVSVDEYLHSSYEYDKEYVDGELIERNMPTSKHSKLQCALSAFLFYRRSEWGLNVYSDVRVHVSDTRYRVVDLCAVPDNLPEEDVIRVPPVFTIEIMSPDDRMAQIGTKAKEYLTMGVTHVWTVDPVSSECYEHTTRGMILVDDGVLRVASTPIEIPIREILDSMQRR